MVESKGMRVLASRAVTCLAILLLSICGASHAFAQQCPQASAAGADIASTVRSLTGDLLYHDGIRKWFELKLDRPQCGKSSIQITGDENVYRKLAMFRGCRVHILGEIHFSPTGYYSLDLYQDAAKIKPAAPCTSQPPLPEYASFRPDRRVRSYTVYMHVDYRPGDHPILFKVQSGSKELRPWQAYASYALTGSFVLYGLCGQGFVVDRVFGDAAAHPAHAGDDMAAYDPETAAESGVSDLHLGYTCIRAR